MIIKKRWSPSSASVDSTLSPEIAVKIKRGKLANAWIGFVKAPLSAKFGFLVIASYVFIALFAPLLTPYGESEIVGSEFELWSEKFKLGTDNLGRDMLTRMFYGARNTVGIAFVTTCLAFGIGGTLGVLAALLRGWTDQILSRIVDVLMAIPQLIFALLLLTIFGTSIPTLIIVIAGSGFHAGVSSGACGQFECSGAGFCGGGKIARRRSGLANLERDTAKHSAAVDRRIWPAFLFCFSDHRSSELSWAGYTATNR